MPIVGLLKKFIRGEEKKSMVKNVPSIVRLETDVGEYWTLKEVIGDGAFGNVYKAVSKTDPTRVAAAKAMELDDDEGAAVMVEVEILVNCVHPNIVQLYDAFIMGNRITLLLEFCGGGAIDSIMVELSRGLSEPQIHCVMKEVLKALQFLHQKNVIHRDLKAGNVLLTNDAKVKLADFGVSAFCKDAREERSTFIGTPYWMAPEVMLCETFPEKKYNKLADIWSFGITLIEMAEERPPYSEMNPAKVVFKVIKADPPSLQRPNQWSSSFRDIVSRCLVKDPQNRPTASDLIAHSFFAKESDFGCVKRLICEMNAEQVTTEVMQSDIDDDDDTSSSIDIRFQSTDIMELLNGTEKTTTDDLMLECGVTRKNDAFENGNDIEADLDRTPRAVAPSQEKVRPTETRKRSNEQETDMTSNVARAQSPTEQIRSKKALLSLSSLSKVANDSQQFTECTPQKQKHSADEHEKMSPTPAPRARSTPDSALMRALTDLDDALEVEDPTELYDDVDDDEKILSGARSPTSQRPSNNSHSLIIVHDDEGLLAAKRQQARASVGVEAKETSPERPPPSHHIKDILTGTATDDDRIKSEQKDKSLSDPPRQQQQQQQKEQSHKSTQHIREILHEVHLLESIKAQKTANEHITHTFNEILKHQATTNIPSNGKITLAVGDTTDEKRRPALNDNQRVRMNDSQQRQRRQSFDITRSPTAPSILENGGTGRRSADTRKDFRGQDEEIAKLSVHKHRSSSQPASSSTKRILKHRKECSSKEQFFSFNGSEDSSFETKQTTTRSFSIASFNDNDNSITQTNAADDISTDNEDDDDKGDRSSSFHADTDSISKRSPSSSLCSSHLKDDVSRLMNEEGKKVRMMADNISKTEQNEDDDVQEEHQSAEINRRLVRNAPSVSATTDQQLRVALSAPTTEEDGSKQSKTVIEVRRPTSFPLSLMQLHSEVIDERSCGNENNKNIRKTTTTCLPNGSSGAVATRRQSQPHLPHTVNIANKSITASCSSLNAKSKKDAEQRPTAARITAHDTTPTTSTSMTRSSHNNNNEYNYFGSALSSSQSSNHNSLPSSDASKFDEKSDKLSYFTAPPPPEPPVDYEDERRAQLKSAAAKVTTVDTTTNSNQTPKRNNAADNVGSRKSPHRQTVTRKTRIYMVDGVQVTSTTHQVFGVKQDYELRKQQLHDLRRLQREEARQLRELHTKADSQRNEQAKRFAIEKENIIKSSDLELQALARTQKHQMKEAEDSHTEDMKQTQKRIQYEQERNLRAFRESLKHEQKHLKMEVDAMPKAQRKDLFRVRKDELDRDQMRREGEFLERQQAEQEITLRKVQLAHKLRILQLEKKFQQQKHAVLRSREASEWDMEEKQTLERHILYKQELKDRFYLQRTQMLARHQRELEHMRKVNEMNEDEAQRNYAVYKKRLPKDFRTESKTRIAMFKESLRISCQGEDSSIINEKMRAFEEKEKMRVKNAMNDHELKAERKLRELRAKNQAAIKELEELHNEKRKMLLEAEQSKLEIYEKEYEQVVADWKAKLPLRKQELEAQFAKELDELDAFYRRDNAELQAITSQPFANQSLF